MAKLSLKAALQADQVIVGTWINATSPALVEIAGHAGFDFVLLDAEHGHYGVDNAENMLRAADAAGVPAVMRVLENTPSVIGKILDLGAQGVVVPHVESAEQALRAIEGAHYPPLGGRGAAPTVRVAQYSRIPWAEHLERAREETLVVLQIEGKQGLQNLDQITAVAGVDVIFVGPFDLSQSLGVHGQLDHPLLLDTVGDIVRRARERNIRVGIWMPRPQQLGPWIERGVQFVSVASSDLIFFEGCRDVAAQVYAQIKKP